MVDWFCELNFGSVSQLTRQKYDGKIALYEFFRKFFSTFFGSHLVIWSLVKNDLYNPKHRIPNSYVTPT